MRFRPLVNITLAVALAALVLLAIAGPGTRLGLWQFPTGFSLLKWGAYFGIAGVVLSIIAFFAARPRGGVAGVLGAALIVSACAFLVPWSGLRQAKKVPPIHDITTDTADPPQFVAVLPLRAHARNSAVYGGSKIAEQQARAYPDIKPLHLALPPSEAFARALDAARSMGWQIVAADTADHRIEATATTRWFGFHDDVVVRIRPEGSGSRVDVRSESRVGGSDIGTNARRVRAYLGRLAA